MSYFACPICHAPLVQNERIYRCQNLHSYDVARQNYVNLLPSHHRGSKNPGDSAEMVSARRAFLTEDHYEPLVNVLAQVVRDTSIETSLVDLGCGEGYFTNAVTDGVKLVYGLDISKPAISNAARSYPAIKFAVANLSLLPLIDHSFDLALSILAPFSESSARVLTTFGKLIRVSPGRMHLREFKELVYREVHAHERAPLDIDGFTHIHNQSLRFEMSLNESSRMHLLGMTPMQFRVPQKRRDDLVGSLELSVTAHFEVDVFEKQAP